MSYLKIENNNIVEAPNKIIRQNGDIVLGYNADSNNIMLNEDGYEWFSKSIDNYQIINGVIKEKEIVQQQKTIFSKLQIRRACRQLGLQDKLNELLNSSITIQADWSDAQEIDLNDQIFLLAISQQIFSQEQIDAVKRILK